MRILVVVGSPSEAIKLGPVYHALAKPEAMNVRCCSYTSQAKRVSEILEFFGIEDSFRVPYPSPLPSGEEAIDQMTQPLIELLTRDPFDLVLLQGDSFPAFAAARAALAQQIPVGHIDAGLRTRSVNEDSTADAHRHFLDQISQHLFVSTFQAREKLVQEGIDRSKIYVTGNPSIDALLWTRDRLEKQVRALPTFIQDRDRLLFVTAHHPSSLGESLRILTQAVVTLADRYPQLQVLFSLAPNEEALQMVLEGSKGQPQIHVREQLPYPDFVNAMMRADVILTDSDAVQEEAPVLGKPVLLTQQLSEHPEAVDAGVVNEVGTDCAVIVGRVSVCLEESAQKRAPRFVHGDGLAAQRIVQVIRDGRLLEPFLTASSGE